MRYEFECEICHKVIDFGDLYARTEEHPEYKGHLRYMIGGPWHSIIKGPNATVWCGPVRAV